MPSATLATARKSQTSVSKVSQISHSKQKGRRFVKVPGADTKSADRWLRGVDRFGYLWTGRKVAVIGLGKSGLAAATWLCHVGARVSATDILDTSQLRAAKASLELLGAEVVLGSHPASLIESSEVVIASPGIKDTASPVKQALNRNIPILSEIELAFRFCPSPIIAVTGTNGKSTVVTLIAQLIASTGRKAVACGNLGIPFTSVLMTLTPQTIAVVEVSSFQLLWCDRFCPNIGVFLNLGTNHLDWHKNREEYIGAKLRLFKRQTLAEWVVLNGKDPKISDIGEYLPARRVWFGENRDNPPSLRIAPETRCVLTDNFQAVLQVGRLLGIADVVTCGVLRDFRGLEHRLEYVKTSRGITFINDSKSTTPDSLLFALSQIKGRVIIILGGRDKGLDFSSLQIALRQKHIGGLVLIGESRARLRAIANGNCGIQECETLKEAVYAAAKMAGTGDTVLLSPACASFDMFRNFEDRGMEFKRIVNNLTNGKIVSRVNGKQHSTHAKRKNKRNLREK